MLLNASAECWRRQSNEIVRQLRMNRHSQHSNCNGSNSLKRTRVRNLSSRELFSQPTVVFSQLNSAFLIANFPLELLDVSCIYQGIRGEGVNTGPWRVSVRSLIVHISSHRYIIDSTLRMVNGSSLLYSAGPGSRKLILLC